MIRTLLLTTALITLMGTSVVAQSTVLVRSGQHDTHTRVVFEGASASGYQVQQTAAGIIAVTLSGQGTVDTSAVKADDVIKSVSTAGQVVTLAVNEGSTFRHFLVGNKIVVDVFKAEMPKATSTAAAKSPPSSPPPVDKKKAELGTVTTTSQAAMAVPAVPAESVEKTALAKALPDFDPHVITVSSTEAFGLSAFEDNGVLWIVTDRASATVPPQLSGPKASLFPAFERMDLGNGAAAYRMRIPQGVARDIRAEGGGLQWRVVIPTSHKEVKETQANRQFANGQLIRGGTMFWPMTGITKIIDLTHPVTGDVIKVVAVDASTAFTGQAMDFVDFATMNAVVGAVIIPKVDDLQVTFAPPGLSVTRPAGLALSRDKDVSRRLMREDVQDISPVSEDITVGNLKKIFDFSRWMMGGLTALTENERILKSTLSTKDGASRIQDLLTLAKMGVANDRGQEALGYLAIAEDEMPQLNDNLEYLALRGAAYGLSGKYETSWADLSAPGLTDFGELGYWKAFTLAWLEDWDQAYAEMPKDIQILASYPKPLLEKMGLKLAEVALRGGDGAQASKILTLLERDRSTLKPWTVAGLDYLHGEQRRQAQDFEEARKLWEPLLESKDRLYRARSGLALTLLELQTGTIDRDKAIDRLEGLRYAWRGDELEAQINYMLGKLYLEQDRYVKGFSILRDASTMALPDSNIGKEITGFMTAAYQDLIVQDKDLSPLDAATIYEEFKELTPPGDAGNTVIQRLAERLVEADLLGRAAALLQHQVDYRLQGLEKARVAVRVAGIYLLDKNSRPAMTALDIAQGIYSADTTLSAVQKKEHMREIGLLRARALSKINRTEEAIELLNGFDPDPDVNALRADIAWQAGLWDDAAEALQDLILDESIDPVRPLTLKHADLILNRAVALNLSGNRVEVANMRTTYEKAMNQTTRGKLFDVITRPRKVSTLSDRETIAGIVSEVDLFSHFLDSYRASGDTAGTTSQ